MKPLLASELKKFLQRFDNFRGGEIRSINVISSTSLLITLVAQDAARAFDWVAIELEFNSVDDAKIIENSQLAFIDMENGITILNDGTFFAFGTNECSNISSVKNSTCFVVCKDLKFKESAF